MRGRGSRRLPTAIALLAFLSLGWGLACSLIYQLILSPFLVFAILIFQPSFPVDKLPRLDWAQLGKLLMGMLGIV